MSQILEVDPKILKQWIDEENVALIDVREVVENKFCAIKNSINLPISEVNITKKNLPKEKNKKVVIYCKTGKRSMMACEKLAMEKGINQDLYNLEGGIDAWQREGLPIVIEKNTLPLERQTHIAISIIIFAGLTAFGMTQNHYYLALPLITAIGLLNSGLTGWCGLSSFITRMPWNRS